MSAIKDLLRLRPASVSLAGIEAALNRLADLYEADLLDRGIVRKDARPPKPESPDDGSADYTNEEADFLEEMAAHVRKHNAQEEEE